MNAVMLRLNDRYHSLSPEKNHFYKTEPHNQFPNTMMDYYKVRNGFEGNSIYIHFYIHNVSGKLIISSFKRLEL